MKSFKTLIILAAAFLSVICCKKDDTQRPGQEGIDALKEFRAEIEAIQTKSILRPANGKTHWEAGDKVLVSNGKDQAVFVYNISRDIFVTDRKDFKTAESYTAVYPAGSASFTDGVFTMTLPQTTSLDPGYISSAPMAAESDSRAIFRFSHLCSVLEIRFPSGKLPADNTGEIESITVNASVPLCGKATLEGSALTMDASAPKKIEFKSSSSSVNTDESIYLLLPAQKYTGDLNFTFVFKDGSTYQLHGTAENILSAGCISFADTDIPWDLFQGGKGTEADPYRLGCSDDIRQLMDKFSSENATAFAAAHYVQTADIDLSGIKDFEPLEECFTGVYDGSGHFIRGLKASSYKGPAGFWRTAKGATIKNLELRDISFESHDFWLGGIAGSVSGTTIENCTVSGSLTSRAKKDWIDWAERAISDDRSNFGFCGGIVAYSDKSTIKGCTFSGRVMSTGKCVGGIVGFADGKTNVDNCKTVYKSEIYTSQHGDGGIAGYVSGESVVSDCDNEASVAAYGGWAGGIAGIIQNGSVKNCVVGSHADINTRTQNCGGIVGVMRPTVTGTALVDACSVYCNLNGQFALGGIAGYIDSQGTVVITNSIFKKGTVNSRGANTSNYNLAGGIVGWIRSGNTSISNCASIPSLVRTAIQNSSSNSGAYSAGGVSGLIGYNSGSSTRISNCYSSFSMSDLRHCYKEVTATAFPKYVWYGGVYGRNTGSLNIQTCYYDNGIQPVPSGDSFSDSEGKAMSTKQMTDGAMLSALNAGRGSDASWVSGSDGWPVLSVSIADPDPVPARQLRVSLIGDSISTFSGYIPAGYGFHYPAVDGSLVNVGDTYWYRLIYDKMKNAVLDANISYSATTVTRTTDPSRMSSSVYENSFTDRYVRLGGMGNPDIVLIHGGTNDRGLTKDSLFPGSLSAASQPDPTFEDLKSCFANADAAQTRAEVEALDNTTFCTAYIKLMRLILQQYPDAKIICIIGDCVYDSIEKSILLIAEHYGAKCVNLLRVNGYNDQVFMPKHDYDGPGSNGCHPGIKAMHFIADKIYDELGPWMEN